MTPRWCRAVACLALALLCLADPSARSAQIVVGVLLALVGIAALWADDASCAQPTSDPGNGLPPDHHDRDGAQGFEGES